MTDPVLTITDTDLSLDGNAGRVDILHDINLTVAAGETLGLVGPSGSGKSSLLMLMGGLEQASSGTIKALGQDLTAMTEDQLARFRRDNMGVVFQSFHLIPTMTALENVATPLELAGAKDAFNRANSNAWLLPAPLPRVLASYWPMNQPAIWMKPTGRPLSICCLICATSMVPP